MPKNSSQVSSPSPRRRGAQNTSPQTYPGFAGFFFLPALIFFAAVSLPACQSTKDAFYGIADWDVSKSWFPGASFFAGTWHRLFGDKDNRRIVVYEPDYIHWFDEFAFVRGSRGAVLRLKRAHDDHPPMMLADGSGASRIYKVRLKDLNFFKQNGFQVLKGGPFLWIDPGLKARKRSRNFRDWMNGYKDGEILERILRYLAGEHPTLTQLVRVGTSVQDRPIYALRISRNYDATKKAVMFNSGHHGMEVLSIDYSLDVACLLLNELCYPEAASMDPELRNYVLDNLVVWIIPMVNPDGLHRFWNVSGYMGRKNANGVDLNRNYPFYWKSWNELASSGSASSYKYRGPEAASEPETRAMMNLARRHRFLLSFSFHTYATRILFPYTADGAANPHPDPARHIAEKIAWPGISYRTTRQYEAARKLYSVDGTDQDWLYHELGTMAFIVEGSMSTPSWEDARRSIRGMRPVSLEAFRQIRQGPRLELTVTDYQGRPLEDARMVLLSRTSYEREAWPRSNRHGQLHVFLVPDEVLYAEIRKPGYAPLRVRLECESVCEQRFQLTPTE